jgi:carbonic anhydrase
VFADENMGQHVENEGYEPWDPSTVYWDYNFEQTLKTCPTTCDATTRCGPACWHKVERSGVNNQCAESSQSPIDIVQASADTSLKFPVMESNGGCNEWLQFSDNHAFEVAFKCSDKMTLDYEGTQYSLLQFHFHYSSEHTVGGGMYAGELHMVHKSADNKLLVLGVFLSTVDTTRENDFMKTFWDVSEKYYNQSGSGDVDSQYTYAYHVSNSAVYVDPYTHFLPASKNYFTYSGSLTTYPCTQGVTWIVFEEAIKISSADLSHIKQAVQNMPNTITLSSYGYEDWRPTLPLNTRSVKYYVDGSTEPMDDDNNRVKQAFPIAIAAVILSGMVFVSLAVYCAMGMTTGKKGEVPAAYAAPSAATDVNIA